MARIRWHQCCGENFEDVYASKVSPTDMNLATLLDQCPLPALSTGGRKKLNSPITLEELTEAVASMANSKSPGTDGVPAEIYKQYSESILVRYLKRCCAIWNSSTIYK